MWPGRKEFSRVLYMAVHRGLVESVFASRHVLNCAVEADPMHASDAVRMRPSFMVDSYIREWGGEAREFMHVPEDVAMHIKVARAADVPLFLCMRDERHASCRIKCTDFDRTQDCKSIGMDVITKTLPKILPTADMQPKLFKLMQGKDYVDKNRNWNLMNNNYLIFLENHFMRWHDSMLLVRNTVQRTYTWNVEMKLAYFTYTHFNEIHAASVVRTLQESVRGNWEEQITLDPTHGSKPSTVDDVIAYIKGRCRASLTPVSEVD